MGLNAAKSQNKPKSNIEPMEAGTYPARIVIIADLGLQEQRAFKGEPKEPAYEILVTYEMLDEFLKNEDGEDDTSKPRWVSENFPLYHLKSEKAKSTKRYITLDPEMKFGGDWTKLIEAPALVTVVNNPGKGEHAGNVYTNVDSVAAMRPKDALRAPKLVNAPVLFDFDNPSVEAFKALPEWVQKKIAGALNFPGSKLEQMLGGKYEPQEEDEGSDSLDDEVPF